VEHEGIRFEVIDVEGLRIERLEVDLRREPPADEPAAATG
jgi:CBS domain containing-hemolysin-like protein